MKEKIQERLRILVFLFRLNSNLFKARLIGRQNKSNWPVSPSALVLDDPQ